MQRAIKKIFIFLIFFFFLQIFLSYTIVRYVTIHNVRKSLHNITSRVKNDLKYINNNQWDTDLYDSDPETPHPAGSSGYSKSLYVITSTGFVIERNKPIDGHLDSSDFKKLLSYQKPYTIENTVNKKWRVFSESVKNGTDIQAVIFVSYYNFDPNSVEETDEILKQNLKLLKEQIYFKNNKLSIDKIDIRNIHYNVSFEIVDKYNIVLLNNGRVPTFIDPSYVIKEMNSKRNEKIIKNAKNGEPFLVYSKTLYDKKNNPIAIIISGESLNQINIILNLFILLSLVINIFIIFPIMIFSVKFAKKQLEKQLSEKDISTNIKPKKIIFFKKEGAIIIDDKKVILPYASNQYYLCLSLFSNPKKRWELDELLEKFGEEMIANNWRKVYDAMLSINKKVGIKLIVHKDKTFLINPEILDLL